MKFTFISDLHCHYPKLIGGDILICSGDVSNYGTAIEIQRFVKWFEQQDYKHKIFIAGNHDKALEHDRLLISSKIIYLEHDLVEVEGLRIFGSPYTPTFGYGWGFNVDRDKIHEKWRDIPENLDILITHGPAYGILDKTHRGDKAGCEALLKEIIQKKPYVHAFGHIHEAQGRKRVGNTLFINSACEVVDMELF